MKAQHFINICSGESYPFLALDNSGRLWKQSAGQEWEPISFNTVYREYYPACCFQTIAKAGAVLMAAGTGEDGLPYLFQSLDGSVWDMVNLTGGSKLMGYKRVTGRINQIVFEQSTGQVFLLCDNGELVTLPDCPKCVRIKKIAEHGLLHGRISGQELHIQTEQEGIIKVPLKEAIQFRVSFSYARQRLKEGGVLIDLTMVDEYKAYELIEHMPQTSFIAFLCEYGIQADAMAVYARRHGFIQAFSLGGKRPLFHEE